MDQTSRDDRNVHKTYKRDSSRDGNRADSLRGRERDRDQDRDRRNHRTRINSYDRRDSRDSRDSRDYYRRNSRDRDSRERGRPTSRAHTQQFRKDSLGRDIKQRRSRSISKEDSRQRKRSRRHGRSHSNDSQSSEISSQIQDVPPTLEEEDDDEMAKMMGFSLFTSTKGEKVHGTDLSAVDVRRKRRKFKQFMNKAQGIIFVILGPDRTMDGQKAG